MFTFILVGLSFIAGGTVTYFALRNNPKVKNTVDDIVNVVDHK